jgi:hypothetical protein
VFDQLLDPVLDEEDAGRLERLDETAGQSDRHAVGHPRVAVAAHPDTDAIGLQPGGRRPHEVTQGLLRLVVAAELGVVDVTEAVAAVQRNPPDPAGLHGGRGRVRADTHLVDVGRHAQRHRAVVGQHVAERVEGLAEGAVDEHAAEPGAVDEQVAVEAPAGLRLDVGDPAAVVAAHVHHVVPQVPDALPHTEPGQVPGQQRGVEVIGVRELRHLLVEGGPADGVRLGAGREQPAVQVARAALGLAERAGDEAVLVELPGRAELQPPVGQAETAGLLQPFEWVVEMVPGVAPVLEADREFVGGVALGHPIALGQAQIPEEMPDRAECRLADADRRDPVRLDERDGDPVAESRAQVGSGHPTRRAAADNYHVLYHCEFLSWFDVVVCGVVAPSTSGRVHRP